MDVRDNGRIKARLPWAWWAFRLSGEIIELETI
jgi:hypothetical protein